MNLPKEFMGLSADQRALIIKKINDRLADLDIRFYPNVISIIQQSSQSHREIVNRIITIMFMDKSSNLDSVLDYIENLK